MHVPTNLKSVALPVPEIIGGTQKIGHSPDTPTQCIRIRHVTVHFSYSSFPVRQKTKNDSGATRFSHSVCSEKYEQESCAIAKITAQCALYTAAVKTCGTP